MKSFHLAIGFTVVAVVGVMADGSQASSAAKASLVCEVYPGLTTGALSRAALGDLPGGVLLQAGSVVLTSAELDAAIAEAPEAARTGLKKNGFFVLERMATKRILLDLARRDATEKKRKSRSFRRTQSLMAMLSA